MKRSWWALTFAMLFPSVMAWVYFDALAGPADGTAGGPNFAVLAAYYLGKAVQFTFPILWVWRFERGRRQHGEPGKRGMTLGVAFGLGVAAAMVGVYHGILRRSELLAKTPALLTAKLEDFHANTPAMFILMALFLCALHSFFEEYYYRWFIFDGLRDHLSLTPAVLISSLAFMGHHVIVLVNYLPMWLAVLFSICVAIGGAVWGWLYHRTGSLLAPWLSHLVVDAAIMIVGYDLAFATR